MNMEFGGQFGTAGTRCSSRGCPACCPPCRWPLTSWRRERRRHCRRRCCRRHRWRGGRIPPREPSLGVPAVGAGAADDGRNDPARLVGRPIRDRSAFTLADGTGRGIGLCAQDGHGDRASARTAARSGVPMMASTLSVVRWSRLRASSAGPRLLLALTPTDRALAESLVHRPEAAGFKGIVVTFDTWLTGWRPRDLGASKLPQLHGNCLANSTSDQPFRPPGWRSPPRRTCKLRSWSGYGFR